MTQAQDYDNPWKAAIHTYLRSFLAVLFPHIEEDIDWSQPREFLDKELLQVTRKSKTRKRHADVIVKVFRRNGQRAWVLIHIEIQSQRDRHFSKRMWTYYYRIVALHDLPVVSLAVLADSSPTWRPEPHEVELWGCQVRFDFPIVKLLDLEPKLDRLLAKEEPFAFVVAAHLKTLHHKSDSRRRLEFKMELIRQLYRKRWTKERIMSIFDLVDWLMTLSAPLEIEFKEKLIQLEEEQKMPYINSIKRMAIDKTREEEGVRSVATVLSTRFGVIPDRLTARLQQVTDLDRLDLLLKLAVTCQSVEEFSEQLPE